MNISLYYYLSGINAASMNEKQLTITRTLDAPVELVWMVFTQPEHIANWWGPNGFTNIISKMEIVPDGEWEFVMHGSEDTDCRNKNIFTEVNENEKIVFDHVTTPKHSTIISLAPIGNQIVLTWYPLFESGEQLQQVVKTFKADVGMKQNVEELIAYLQKETMQNTKDR